MKLAYTEWEKRYDPVWEEEMNEDGETVEYLFEVDFDDEAAQKKYLAERRLWTEMENDHIYNERRIGGRVRYLVTKKPYKKKGFIDVQPLVMGNSE